jgi:hypothetical protein
VSTSLALQLLQTAQLYNLSGAGVVMARVRLSASGIKFAASTADGVLYVADVSSTDQTLSNVQRVQVGNLANLQEALFDPNEQDVYTADQDNGGIYGYALTSSGPPTALAGSPFSTGSLPRGPTGMAFNSTGDHLYVVMGRNRWFSRIPATAMGNCRPLGIRWRRAGCWLIELCECQRIETWRGELRNETRLRSFAQKARSR